MRRQIARHPLRDSGHTLRVHTPEHVLSRVLQDLRVSHLFASEYNRTQQTLAPLAARSGLEVMQRSARQPKALIRELRALPDGAVAIIAGHSNTIPGLVCDLGGRPEDLDCSESGRALDEKEYDRLYLLLLPPPDAAGRSPLRTLSLRYGD